MAVHSRWLLVWDNLDNLEWLQRFLPPVRPGSLLVTTHRQALGGLIQGINLPPLRQEEGIALLLRRANLLKLEATREQVAAFIEKAPAECTAASELVATLGGLPLALDQVGAYVEETGCSLTDYLQRYQQRHVYLLNRRGELGGNHPQSVTATFLLVWEQLGRKHRAAAEILRVCALLYAEAIPEEFFLVGGAHLGAELAALAADPSHFDQAIAILRSLSLLQRQPENHTLSLHRLVQAVVQEQMSKQEHDVWLQRVVDALNTLFPETMPKTWVRCERLLPHVLVAASLLSDEKASLSGAEMFHKAADYLRERAQYQQAETLYRRALLMREQMPGADHAAVAQILSGLARILFDQGKEEQAEPLYRQALHAGEQARGADHLALTSALTGLGNLYLKKQKYEQAEALYQRALLIREQALGPEHLEVAPLLNNLAVLYYSQGRYEQAEALYQRALLIREQALEPEHRLTASQLNNLALLYADQGRYEQAEQLYQRALCIWQQTLGSEHPLVAYPLYNLAELYMLQGQYEQAERLYQQAVGIWERSLGADNPVIANALNGLGNLYQEQGNEEQAETYYQQALSLRERLLGEQHVETAQTLHDLAILYQRQGKVQEALSLARRALLVRGHLLGEQHRLTIASCALTRALCQEQAHPEKDCCGE